MPAFLPTAVRVSVPATSANLGPGFDSLGLALTLRDELTAEVTGSGLVVEVDGAGAHDVPGDESHLVVRAMRAGFEVLGGQPPGLVLHCENRIPHARGLGSSSAAIVGGLALARACVEGGADAFSDDALFQLAARIEGHPDNVAPACYGGFVISSQDESGFHALRTEIDPSISAVVMVPPGGVETTVARGLLPAEVSHADAAANSGAAALLVAALTGHPEELFRATHDRLHQEYRRPSMPASLDLVDRLRAQGHAAVISGAGPTVLVFAVGEGELAGRLVDECGEGWQVWPLAVDRAGVRVEA